MKGIEFLLLGLGALADAFLRYKIAESPVLFRMLPINILIINVVGSFILGIFVVKSMYFNLDPKYLLYGMCLSYSCWWFYAEKHYLVKLRRLLHKTSENRQSKL